MKPDNPDVVRKFGRDVALLMYRQVAARSSVEAEQFMGDLVHGASLGDPGNDEIIRAIVADHVESDRLVPLILRNYVAGAMLMTPNEQKHSNKQRRGPNVYVLAGRNACIKGPLRNAPTGTEFPHDDGMLDCYEALGEVGIHMSKEAIKKVRTRSKRAAATTTAPRTN